MQYEDKQAVDEALMQDKHRSIDDSVNGIDEVIDKAQSLLNRILNNDSQNSSVCEPDKIPRQDETLSSVLSETPKRIDGKKGELNRILNDITEALF